MATGLFDEDDIGVACYHSKTGAVELHLNHLLDQPGEYVVVDCTAGAESFASRMFTRFDLTFLVCEPTRKGIGVYQQWASYAADYGVAVAVVGSKVHSDEDAAFLREQVGDALLTCFGHEPAVRAMEQGRSFALAGLNPAARQALAAMRGAIDARSRDWEKLTRQATQFHLRNARAWASSATGENLEDQVDPEFCPRTARARARTRAGAGRPPTSPALTSRDSLRAWLRVLPCRTRSVCAWQQQGSGTPPSVGCWSAH